MPEDIHWGPGNPHPLSQIRTELMWEEKYDEYGRWLIFALCTILKEND